MVRFICWDMRSPEARPTRGLDLRTGSAMAWSNNAENVYSFRINRVEPLYIPFVSKVMGPVRYDFFVGSVKGHTYLNVAVGARVDVLLPADEKLRVWV